ncbi:50S ribosomal protein L6 [Candidatus Woesearchaeota archaeon]|nr:50S ribosomal protein L6 [Candidatus Woesearchaeota archaeon]
MKQNIEEKIEIPEKIEVQTDKGMIKVKGPKGEVSKKLINPKVKIEVKDKNIIFSAKKGTKREKKIIETFKSHVRNLIQGASENHIYKLKICSTHFPMTASIKDNEFVLQNFLGEKVPRKLKIKENAEVKIEGEEITVKSPDKELAGQTAASIEGLCKISGRDRRVFQDGIYIISKSEKNIENG